MTSAVTVTIDRTGLSLSPLVLSGSVDGTSRRLVSFAPPALQARVTYMPESVDVDGTEAIAASWQQAMLGFGVKMVATTETALHAGYAELVAAIGQFAYTVTTQLSGATAEVWSADRGSIQLADSTGRTFSDVHNLNPVYTVTIPVYPVPA